MSRLANPARISLGEAQRLHRKFRKQKTVSVNELRIEMIRYRNRGHHWRQPGTWLNTGEVGFLICRSRATVYGLIRNGALRARQGEGRRPGTYTWLVPIEDVIELVEFELAEAGD